MNEVEFLLQYFGITADKLFPIAIILGLGLFLLFKYFLKPNFNFLKKSIKNIDDDLTKVNNATTEIQSYFTKQGFTMLHQLTMRPGSPFVLTEYGEKLVNESGFPEIFRQNREKIINTVKSYNPQTNYDIQEYSKKVLLENFLNDPIMKPVKDYAFQNSIKIEIILEAATLLVRDEVMKELKFDN
ncbi:MAG: hypothetical protein Athens101410_504 [Parcubacteria group bacterium Athens1014_10]|nr:MAG: hypothetical protein Athens101410_504 [Parcubacteria group bacterium Athens1014_10]TSD05430.1 MAG: hypothetical protein Athens071412_339 [Parcubacteria group bacterium Athens0714_12]